MARLAKMSVSTIGELQHTISIKHGDKGVEIDIYYNDNFEVVKVEVWPTRNTELNLRSSTVMKDGASMAFKLETS